MAEAGREENDGFRAAERRKQPFVGMRPIGRDRLVADGRANAHFEI